MKNVMKKVLAVVMCAAMIVGFIPTKVKAAEVKAVTFKTITNISQLQTVDAVDSRTITTTNESEDIQRYYLKLTLPEDSWVYLGGSYTMNNHDKVHTKVILYANSTMTSEIKGFDYTIGNSEPTGFMAKGTYYMSVAVNKAPYWREKGPFTGNVNIMAVAFPVSKVFATTVVTNKSKTQATVTWKNTLGNYLHSVQYQPGKFGATQLYDNNTWKWSVSGYWTGGSANAKKLEPKGDVYSFTANKSGYHTFMISTNGVMDADRFCKAINITTIDDKKPVVKGVKNGKTYKKAVKIKFSDAQTGIKSAKLNKKKIKSGKKVSKKGKYTLVVIDKAGNKTTIKFKIKK